MIPLKLQLRNFMSYGENVQALQFEGMNLACLSGDNGNGKTAILDAMTWALFGETRAKSEDSVIRIGKQDCEVLFDFQVGDSKYRVRRMRSVPKTARGAASTVWEFQIWQDDNTLRSLSGTTPRETKAKIRDLLHMDFDTFVATAYLAQGRADEFTKATPTRRKDILAGILDLSRFDRLADMAKEKQRDADRAAQDASSTLNVIQAELDREDIYRQRLDDAQTDQARILADLAQIDSELDAVRARLTQFEQQENIRRELETQNADLSAETDRLQKEAEELQRWITAAEQYSERRGQIEADIAAYESLTGRLEELQSELARRMRLADEVRALEQTIQAAKVALEREQFEAHRELVDAERANAEVKTVEVQLATIETELRGYDTLEAKQEHIATALNAAQDEYTQRKGEFQFCQSELERLRTRLTALQSSNATECEYCGQPLNTNGRARAIVDTETAISAMQARHDSVRDAGKLAKRTLTECEEAQKILHEERQKATNLQMRQESLRESLKPILERAARTDSATQRLEAVNAEIAAEKFAPLERARLVVLTPQLVGMDGLTKELQEAQTRQRSLQTAPREHERLQTALRVLETDPPRLAEIVARAASCAERRADVAARLARVGSTATELAVARAQAEQLSIKRREKDAERSLAEREIGTQTANLERCAQRRQEMAVRVAERDAALKDAAMYKELAASFGRQGVQALIIENAIPEIQEEANALLQQLTTNGTSVQLLTSRQARSRDGEIETLDIEARDGEGARPYEMFSGGEAFRINFALRVALSKLLSRRAGAPLETLIIDEGFGTQDGRGREAIAETLHQIASDFSLVLVITHMDDLKDSFPVRIEVAKGPEGSSFQIESAS